MLLNLLKNNVSKSLLYILFFAGILKLSGMILTWFWNSYMIYSFDVEHITFLESVGMLAFFYLVYSGVKFGFSTISAQFNLTDKMSTKELPKCHTCEQNVRNTHNNYVKNLTPDEKEQLKEAIAKCCGFNHENSKNKIPQQVTIQKVSKIS